MWPADGSMFVKILLFATKKNRHSCGMLNTVLPVKVVSLYNTPSYVTVINLVVISTASKRAHQHQAGRDGCITVFNSAVHVTIILYFLSPHFVHFVRLAFSSILICRINLPIFLIKYFIQSKHNINI